MESEELQAIVTRHGGTRGFAARLRVSQRIVQYWLARNRKIRPVIEDRIRDLEAADHPTLRSLTTAKER
jgi:hypothetical protein